MERESRTKTKKGKIVKEDSPFQFRQNVVVSHGKQQATQQSIQQQKLRDWYQISQSINRSIGLDQSWKEKRTAALNDPRATRSSNPDAG
jgi:hypothetical protein